MRETADLHHNSQHICLKASTVGAGRRMQLKISITEGRA